MKTVGNSVSRVLWKTFVAPIKYRGRGGYDAGAYWRDRLASYGPALTGPGHEGRTESENIERYRLESTHLLQYLSEHGIAVHGRGVLEIGCGNGYYTDLIAGQGPASFTGIDVTDVMFDDLRSRHPGFQFVHADISGDLPPFDQPFDIVLMIDVVQHIVSAARLDTALANVERLMAPGGVFIISGLRTGLPLRGVFNVRRWPESQILDRLPGFTQLPGRPLPGPSLALAASLFHKASEP
jgi:SAM-dependent methyltransferase